MCVDENKTYKYDDLPGHFLLSKKDEGKWNLVWHFRGGTEELVITTNVDPEDFMPAIKKLLRKSLDKVQKKLLKEGTNKNIA